MERRQNRETRYKMEKRTRKLWRLMRVARRGDSITVQEILQDEDFSIDGLYSCAPHGFPTTPLLCAVEGNNFGAVEALLNAGADPNLSGRLGNPPLFEAIKKYNGDKRIVDALLRKGVDPTRKDNMDETIFHALAECHYYGQEMPVSMLCSFLMKLSDSFDFDCRNIDGCTSLFSCCRELECDRVGVIQELLRRVDPNIPDHDGTTPLIAAIENGLSTPFVIRALLEGGADPNVRDREHGETALFHAIGVPDTVEQDETQAVEALLNGGADPTIQNTKGLIPLHRACACGNIAIALILIKHGLGTDCINAQGDSGETPLYVACQQNQTSIVEALLLAGADPLLGDMNWKSPIHVAAEVDSLTIVKLLTDCQGPEYANVLDNKGRTPLHFACAFAATNDTVQYLIDMGSSLEARDHLGNNPFFGAIKYRETKGTTGSLVEVLLNAGADPLVRNNSSCTLLHEACRFGGDFDLLEVLLKRSDQLKCLTCKTKDTYEETPLDSLKRRFRHFTDDDHIELRARLIGVIIKGYVRSLTQRDGSFSLHSALQKAERVAIEDEERENADYGYQLPIGTLNEDELYSLVKEIGTAVPETIRAVTADGLVPLQIACKGEFPVSVLDLMLRWCPDTVEVLVGNIDNGF